MKKNLKRYLSFLLVLVMCVSLMPASAFAGEEPAEAECEEAAVCEEDNSERSLNEEDGYAQTETGEAEAFSNEDSIVPETALVRVCFICEGLKDLSGLSVFDENGLEMSPCADETTGEILPGMYCLAPGGYTYSLHCADGGIPDVEDVPFTVMSGISEQQIAIDAFGNDDSVLPEVEFGSGSEINPEYEGIVDEKDIPEPSISNEELAELLLGRDGQIPSDSEAAGAKTYHTSVADAAAEARPHLVARDEEFIIYFKAPSGQSPYTLAKSIHAAAFAHTGVPKEGDSLLKEYGGYRYSWARTTSSGTDYFTFTYIYSYYTTAAQEEILDAKVTSILSRLNLAGKTDYQKIKAIYDYLCLNVTYDYDTLEDDSYLLKYTSYAALVNSTAVCQGYAVAFYRLCLEAGIDARVVRSGEMHHAWNIVRYGSCYYEMDATWDSSRYTYKYFLKGSTTWLSGHQIEGYSSIGDEFSDAAFAARYCLPGEDVVTCCGKCGADMIWELSPEGLLTISGTGVMTKTPWRTNYKDSILDIVVEEGVAGLAERAFSSCANVRNVSLPGSLASIGEYAFYDNAITSITIPAGVTAIDGYAFKYCDLLDTVIFEGEAPAIADTGFYRISADVYYPCTGSTWTDARRLNYGGTLSWVRNHGYSNHVCAGCGKLETGGDTANGVCGEGLSWSLFSDGALVICGSGEMNDYSRARAPWNSYIGSITEIILDSGITSIGENAFAGCTGLSTISIPGSIRSIGEDAFYGCSGITEVDAAGIGDWLKISFASETANPLSGGAELCLNGVPLTALSIPEGVTSISGYAFCGCEGLESVAFPAGITGIGQGAFAKCKDLSEIVFEGSAPSIGTDAFGNDTVYIDIPCSGWPQSAVQDYGGTLYWHEVHDWNITYTWTAGGKSCTASAVCGNDAAHVVAETAAASGSEKIPATCTENGTTEYTAVFTNVLFSTQKENLADIPALGHSWNKTYTWAADGKSCTASAVCGNDAAHVVAETAASAGSEKIPATCTENGTTEYTAVFTNALFSTQKENLADIPALGHDWDAEYVWSEDGKTCAASAVCRRDAGHKETESVDCEGAVKTGATCKSEGVTEYTARFTKDAFTVQTTDVTDIPISGHKFENHRCVYCTFPEEGYVSLELAQEYLLLEKGVEIQLKVAKEYEELSNLIVWSVDGENIVSVDGAGKVTAVGRGKAVVTAGFEAYGQMCTADCRIDVTESGAVNEVSAVTTSSSRLTVELYRTDYTQIDILPVIEQNLLDGGAASLADALANAGAAVEKAEFADTDTAAVFDLAVKDDRTLLIVPKAGAAEGRIKTVSSYKSAVNVWLAGSDEPVAVTGDRGTAAVLSLSVKKSTPSIRAVPLKKFNTFDGPQSMTQALQFTGGTVTAVEINREMALRNQKNDATLKGFKLNDDMTVSAEKNRSGSGTLYLLCTVDGWTVKRALSLSCSASVTKPKITFRPSSVTLLPGTFDRQEVAYTVTPAEFASSPVIITDSAGLDLTAEDGKITVSAANAPAAAATYTVKASVEGIPYRFTVKTLAPSTRVTLSLRTAGTIDAAVPGSFATVTATLKNSHAGNGETYGYRVLREMKGEDPVDVTSSFEGVWNGNVLTLTEKDETAVLQGYTYTLCVKSVYGEGLETPEARTRLSIKRSDPARAAASASISTSGSIDVLRPDSAMTVKPSVRNLYGYESSLSFARTYDSAQGKAVNEPCDELFDVTIKDGQYTVKVADGAKVCYKDKFTVSFTASYDGKTVTAEKTFALKQGSAKITQSTKSVDMLKRDRYSTAVVELSTDDETLAGIDFGKLRLSNDSGILAMKYLGHGEIELSYKESKINAKVSSGKTKTVPVKIDVFMIGNETEKPNATVSLTVNFK